MTELDAVFSLWPLHAHKTIHILHTQMYRHSSPTQTSNTNTDRHIHKYVYTHKIWKRIRIYFLSCYYRSILCVYAYIHATSIYTLKYTHVHLMREVSFFNLYFLGYPYKFWNSYRKKNKTPKTPTIRCSTPHQPVSQLIVSEIIVFLSCSWC